MFNRNFNYFPIERSAHEFYISDKFVFSKPNLHFPIERSAHEFYISVKFVFSKPNLHFPTERSAHEFYISDKFVFSKPNLPSLCPNIPYTQLEIVTQSYDKTDGYSTA